jgi:very-short-patch-repair endonuclease
MSAIRKHNRRRKPSSLETTVYGWLEEMEIEFHREYPIGRCHADIFLPPRTVIELQGCWYHGCRSCYRDLTDEQQLAQAKDGRRFAFFRSRGLAVVEIWEHDVLHNPEMVRRILEALSGQKD